MTEQTGKQSATERRLRLPSPGMSGVIALVLALAAATLSCWWPCYCEQRVIRQMEAQELNVEVTWEYVGPELLRRWSDREWMNWLRRVQVLRVNQRATWRSSFSNVIRGTSPANTLEPLPSLAPLHRCTALELSGLLINGPECLRGAAGCERLARLQIGSSQVSYDVLRGLDGLNQLQEIRMNYVSVPGDLLELPLAPSLRSFRSDRTMFRSLDVSGTPELRRIEAKNCSFSDEGATMLLDAAYLEVLMVPNGTLTDTSVDDLLQLRNLRYLDLRFNSQLTRTGLERLADLPRLHTVNVFETEADNELTELRHVLPQAKSTYEP